MIKATKFNALLGNGNMNLESSLSGQSSECLPATFKMLHRNPEMVARIVQSLRAIGTLDSTPGSKDDFMYFLNSRAAQDSTMLELPILQVEKQRNPNELQTLIDAAEVTGMIQP